MEENQDIVSDEEPVYQQDQKDVESSPDAQEVNDLQAVMSEDENSKEIISNYSIDETEEENIHGKLVQQFKNFTEV